MSEHEKLILICDNIKARNLMSNSLKLSNAELEEKMKPLWDKMASCSYIEDMHRIKLGLRPRMARG